MLGTVVPRFLRQLQLQIQLRHGVGINVPYLLRCNFLAVIHCGMSGFIDPIESETEKQLIDYAISQEILTVLHNVGYRPEY